MSESDKINFNCHPILNERLRNFEANVESLSGKIFDLTFGYPEKLQEDWMSEIESDIDFKTIDTLKKKDLKKKIQNYFYKLFQHDSILLTTSASEALMVAIHTCILDREDEVILFDFGFYTYPALIRTGKGKPIFAAREKNGNPNIESIKSNISKKTKAILITQPENPLGKIFNSNELKEICLLCVENNLTLIVDHSFVESSPFGNEIPILTDFKNLSFFKDLSWIVIGDTGKILCLHGVKYACLLSSENHKEAIDNWLHLILFQYDIARMYILSRILNDSKFTNYKISLNKVVADNYYLLEKGLDSRIKILKPQATPMVLLDISSFEMDDLSFVEKLLQEEKVALMPGIYFVQSGEDNAYYSKNIIRMAISRPKEDIEEAIVKINRFLSKLSG